MFIYAYTHVTTQTKIRNISIAQKAICASSKSKVTMLTQR